MAKKTELGNGKTDAKPNGSTKPPILNKDVRVYLSQTEVPSVSLEHALRVPRAIAEQHGFRPTSPLNVAIAMGLQPSSSNFRRLAGAAIGYGLTKGGPNADEIAIEPLGMKVVRPTADGEDHSALREALLKPRVIGDFLKRYDKAQLPREDIGRNVLVEFGVPPDRSSEVLKLILEGAESVGFIKSIKGKQYVDLSGVPMTTTVGMQDEDDEGAAADAAEQAEPPVPPPSLTPDRPAAKLASSGTPDTEKMKRRVFVAHGKNRAFLDPIKKLLGFGELEPVISVERTSVSQPLPDKVFNEMRSCGAAIIHLDAEQTLTDADGNPHIVLNPNVLIEIGAAIALYGRRYILLVRDGAGVKVPSDLQGVFEVRYKGDVLDADATIRLMESIKDIKNHPLPERYPKE